MPHTVGAPAPTSARQGREKQRYGADGERLVAGCIPVRRVPGAAGPAGVQVLMISSRGGNGHVFPKGGWEVDEELEAAAARETVEEAGVRGALELPALGAFAFHSNKAERLNRAHRGRCVVHVFAMAVEEELGTWPEAGQRTREWVPLAEAHARCRYDWMRAALSAWMLRRGWTPPAGAGGGEGAPPEHEDEGGSEPGSAALEASAD